jgi:hypothetical protein
MLVDVVAAISYYSKKAKVYDYMTWTQFFNRQHCRLQEQEDVADFRALNRAGRFSGSCAVEL